MVADELQRGKERSHCSTEQVLSAIGPHNTGYCGRNIAKGEQFPDVTSVDDNEEIG